MYLLTYLLTYLLMLVLMESPYVTSYEWTILTYILSRTVLQLSRSIGQIIAFDRGVPLVNALVLANLCECLHKS